jgi:hypothetical protein
MTQKHRTGTAPGRLSPEGAELVAIVTDDRVKRALPGCAKIRTVSNNHPIPANFVRKNAGHVKVGDTIGFQSATGTIHTDTVSRIKFPDSGEEDIRQFTFSAVYMTTAEGEKVKVQDKSTMTFHIHDQILVKR